jgi:hypothetical protein
MVRVAEALSSRLSTCLSTAKNKKRREGRNTRNQTSFSAHESVVMENETHTAAAARVPLLL